MLRSFEHLSHPADAGLLLAADEERVTVLGRGSGYATPWHWHDCFMLILPDQGAIELKHEDQREGTWLSPDRFAIVPPDHAHETRAGLGTHTHLALYVTRASLRRLDERVGSLSAFHKRASSTIVLRRTAAIRALQDLSTRRDAATYGAGAIQQGLSSALLLQCIAEVVAGRDLSRASPRTHGAALVADLKAYVALHAADDLPLDLMSERFGVSRRHMTRLFRDGTGLSIGAYQLHMRLEQARDLLVATDLPVGDIAFRTGFESGAALARAMRRAKGCAPSDIRARMARLIKT